MFMCFKLLINRYDNFEITCYPENSFQKLFLLCEYCLKEKAATKTVFPNSINCDMQLLYI
jgi:hypothetical protein